MKKIDFVSQPSQHIQGKIKIPGDKSISHRAIILGAIAKGITHIEGFLDGEDCMATLHALRSMGVSIQGPIAQTVIIKGVEKYGLKTPKFPIDCGNSGTSMRLLAGLLAAQPFDSTLIGDESLIKRPMERIYKPLTAMGASLKSNGGRPPLTIQGGQHLQGITYTMPQASAQVKSCILLAGLYASGKTTVIEPSPTRDHTERLLKAFSYPLYKKDNAITIDSNYECVGTNIKIPGDLSSAAFFIIAATLIPDSQITIENLGINPTRTGIITLLQNMGADIKIENKRWYGEELVADLIVQSAPLKGITVPEEYISLAIDELPILCIAAAFAKGTTIVKGAKELRFKESDRITAMVQGLQRLGISAQALDDGFRIQGGIIEGGEVDSFSDHRIAMAFSIAGAVAKKTIIIKNCTTVNTSFPTFIKTAQGIGMSIQEIAYEI